MDDEVLNYGSDNKDEKEGYRFKKKLGDTINKTWQLIRSGGYGRY